MSIMTASYIRNSCYYLRTGKPLFQMFTNAKAEINSIQAFGTFCYTYVQNKNHNAKIEIGIFVVYDKVVQHNLVYFSFDRVRLKS